MRSNRSGYSAAPAGSARALKQKPRPKRPKQEWNQLFLMLFFIVLPVIGLLAIFFQPVRWLFMVLTVVCLILMWLMRAFLFPGRMIITAVYGLLLVFTLVTALGAQSSRAQISRQQSFFASATAAPTQTPLIVTYNAGDYATGYMEDDPLSDFSDVQEVGLSGGSGDESGIDLGVTDTGATDYVSTVKSAAEESLEDFMEKWRKGIIADMVEYTPPSWRNAQEGDSGSQQLFWKFAQRPLVDWRQMSAPTGTDASTARTITVEADVNYGGETRTYQYDAVILYENNKWYVDPNSLSSGILVVAATATPDPNLTPTPSPVPTPTPTPGPKTKLYYNKDGGRKYHADQNCPSVSDEYLPLSGSFTYKDLNKSPYTRLEPCEKCEAPSR